MMESCKHKNADYRSIHEDGCCSCHISPPCSYCTDQEQYCSDCDEVLEEYNPPKFVKNIKPWMPTPFSPRKCGKGIITGYNIDGRSGSTMVFRGTYKGDVTNEDLLDFFGTGTFGHRFGRCSGGVFSFTKITDWEQPK